MVCFKINKPTEDLLEHQFLQIYRNLIAKGTIFVDFKFHNNYIEDINIAYVDISDAYHNKLRAVVYTKHFRCTIVEHYGVKFTTVTIFPPEKRKEK